MQLPDIKELDALIKLCRKNGIAEVSFGELKLTFLPPAYQPPMRTRKGAKASPTTAQPENPLDPHTDGWDSLSDEAKLMWSTSETPVPTEAGPGAIQ